MKFFKNLSWLIVLNLLVKPVWIFLVDRKVQLMVGHEAYGSYFAIFNLSVVLVFIADAGLSNMMNQQLAYKGEADVRQLLRVKILLVSAYVLVCMFVGWLTGVDVYLMLYVVLIQALTSMFVFFRSIITAQQHYDADVFFSVLDKSLMIVLCSGFIYGLFRPINIEIFLQVQLLSTAVAVAAAIIFVKRKSLFSAGEKMPLGRLLQLLFPFAVIILLMSLHYRLDGFLLERIHLNGAYQAGVYASAYRLLDAANMIGYLAASFLVPFIARNQKNMPMVRSVVDPLRNSLLILAVAIAGFAWFFPLWLQQLLYHSDSSYISIVFQLTLASLPAYYLVHVYGSVLTATSRLPTFIALLVAAVAMNLLLNLLLIPAYGALGCCMAALASQYTCALGLWLVVHFKLKMPVSFATVFRHFAFAIMMLVFFYMCRVSGVGAWAALFGSTVLGGIFIVAQFLYFRKNFPADA